MKIVFPNFSLTVADSVINKIAENPYKFPRPAGTPGTVIIDGSSLPAVKFVPMITYLYERCMEFLLQRCLANLRNAEVITLDFRRTVYIHPWAFSCTLNPISYLGADDLEELIKDKSAWGRFFSLEITNVEVKYREQAGRGQIIPKPEE